MLFNSIGYVLLLTGAVGLHWLLPERYRTTLVVAVSIFFYGMWRWDFTFLVVFSAAVDFVCAGQIDRTDRPGRRRAFLLISLVTNLGLLVFFKYAYFLSDNVSAVGSALGLGVGRLRDLGFEIILPLGISFYTFQTISYTIDVYRKVSKPTRHFPTFLAYVMFWPQLIAGPILRPSEVVPQLEKQRRFEWDSLSAGVLLVLVGLCKKVVLADSISGLAEAGFAPDAAPGTALDVWVSSFLFGFQIYFDFSGYSDVAIGSALMLGFRFPDNFNWPYMATSPRDFWRRWHISLSSWIRDYLYLPLTGERFRTKSTGGISVASEANGKSRTRALLATWFIMGLWHGANWTFALWGIYHALLILAYRVISPLRRLPDRSPWIAWVVMLPLVMAGWIPFRAPSMRQALAMFGRLIEPGAYTFVGRSLAGYHYLAAATLTAGMVLWFQVQRLVKSRTLPSYVTLPSTAIGTAAMAMLLLAMLRPLKQFIYFQF